MHTNTLGFLIPQVDISTLKKIAIIKANSFLDNFKFTHSPDSDNSYLVIGQNLIGYGLEQLGYDITVVDGLGSTKTLVDIVNSGETFDYTFAADEHFTKSSTEAEQVMAIEALSKLTNIALYTTLKDYRNMHASQRFFQEPFEVKTPAGEAIIIRKRDWNKSDRQQWTNREWIIQNDELIVCAPIECRTMYFKQLAKFSSDAGAKNFQVEKKQMYKPLFSKSFEYIICISIG
jgi:hypothetical protein|tara:strand:- start:178 stop:873 length:696 start_codon:yes stop_codon:yes gene_type:complete